MNIAIAGCGITGTTAACFLAQAGHQVTIFEKAPVCQPVGAGIMLQPSGQAILDRLNLLEPVEAVSAKLVGMTAKLTSGRNLIQLRYDRLSPANYAVGVHRGRLFEILLAACKEFGVTIRNGCRVVDFQQQTGGNSQLRLEFETDDRLQSEAGFDFLIGTDGIRSAIRQQMQANNQLKSRFFEYDYAALWMTNQTEYQSDQLFQIVEGTQKLIGLLPIGLNECSFFWGLPAGQYEELIKGDFGKWKSDVIRDCPEAELLLHDRNGFDQFTFGKYGHVRINRASSGQVILLGDAAHATSPHLGQGANLGLEDAFVFFTCLEEAGEFAKACQLYHARRSAKIRYYQLLTRFLSPFFQSKGRILGRLRDTFLPWFPYLPIVRRQMLRTLSGFKNGWLG